VTIRAGARVDQVALTFPGGTAFAHGGTGGTPQSLALAAETVLPVSTRQVPANQVSAYRQI
jgi:hypothetical protein